MPRWGGETASGRAPPEPRGIGAIDAVSLRQEGKISVSGAEAGRHGAARIAGELRMSLQKGVHLGLILLWFQ
jgi:hypothetical protein